MSRSLSPRGRGTGRGGGGNGKAHALFDGRAPSPHPLSHKGRGAQYGASGKLFHFGEGVEVEAAAIGVAATVWAPPPRAA